MDNIKKTTKIYASAAWKHKRWLLLNLFSVSIAATLGSIIIPLISSRGINALPGYLENGGNFGDTFNIYIFGFIACSVTAWLLWRASGISMIKFEVQVMRDLHRKVFNHLTTLSYRFFTNTFGGSLVAQTNRFVSSFERIYDTLAFDLLFLIIRFLLSTVIIFTFAPTLAIGLLVWSIFFTASAVFLTIKKTPYSRKAAAEQSKTTGSLSDSLTNISNVKYFANEKLEKENFKKVTDKLAKARFWDWGLGELIFSWQGFLALIFEIVVFWASLSLVASQKIDLGQLVLIQFYMGNLIWSLVRIPGIVRRFETAYSDATEMTEILHTKSEIKDVAKPLKCKIKAGAIEFKDVNFDHKDSVNNDPLFNKLNVKIKPGEKIGLVGPSGGGKTTLTKLLLRISDIDGGTIKIDGQNIAKLKQEDLRGCITYVPQEPILFHRSLLENIQYGKLDASLQEVTEAAKKAHAHDFIGQLPNEYDTLVGERGIKLSGGQRQRVAIARAMLKDAPILVLDEATSALDSESEKLIQEAMWKLMQGKTAIVVAHRLSTIQKLDRIIVMDKGQVVEEGTHKQLVAKKGLYAKLWAHQSGDFLQE